MADITPKDVAKGMLKYITKETDTVLVSKSQFLEACAEAIDEMNTDMEERADKYGKPLPPEVSLVLIMDRASLGARIAEKLFNNGKE